jgi:hypothetical protein
MALFLAVTMRDALVCSVAQTTWRPKQSTPSTPMSYPACMNPLIARLLGGEGFWF